MGRDKATLEVGGQPLLARQIELVRQAGASEVFVSGRADAEYASFGCEVLHDLNPEAGPLAGVERGLATATTPLLLVLAVDLPLMTADFLQRLLMECEEETGAAPQMRGKLEPLAAVYPCRAHALAVEHLRVGKNGMQHFATEIEKTGGLRRLPVTSSEEELFFNWNLPEPRDLQ
jgi:molybdopterin-guanine dinucleotide biosynthesis protein A